MRNGEVSSGSDRVRSTFERAIYISAEVWEGMKNVGWYVNCKADEYSAAETLNVCTLKIEDH